MTKQLPETILSGLISPYESLNAIGKVMEFIAGATASLSHNSGEALDSYGDPIILQLISQVGCKLKIA